MSRVERVGGGTPVILVINPGSRMLDEIPSVSSAVVLFSAKPSFSPGETVIIGLYGDWIDTYLSGRNDQNWSYCHRELAGGYSNARQPGFRYWVLPTPSVG
jgi:hypothetical protein